MVLFLLTDSILFFILIVKRNKKCYNTNKQMGGRRELRILIIHTAFIGDIVLSTPIIEKLKTEYPNSEIYYLTTPISATLLKSNPDINEVLIFDKKSNDKGVIGLLRTAMNLRKYKFDKVFVLHRYMRSSTLAFLSGGKERIGFESASGSFLYNKKVRYNSEFHEIERVLSLVESKSKQNDQKEYKIKIYTTPESKVKIDKFWNEFSLFNKQIITIAPGSKWFTKMWPSEYFDTLIDQLSQLKSVSVVLIGGNEDKEILLINANKTIDLRGETSLLDMAEILNRTDILVSNDSSPLHIASSFERPFILAIFGPTTKSLGFTPSNKKNKIMEVPDLTCRPCGLHGSAKCPLGHFKCMKNLYPEIILKEIKNIISNQKI